MLAGDGRARPRASPPIRSARPAPEPILALTSVPGIHRHSRASTDTGVTVLSPLDDYPVHQISEPMRFVGTSDRNFYDRYYFNVHGTGETHGTNDDLFAVIGLGQYPNLSVADAFVSVLWGETHRVLRGIEGPRGRSDGPVGRADPRRGATRPRAGTGRGRAERMGHRARRGLRRFLRGSPGGAPLRPAVRPGDLRLDALRAGRVVGGDPARRGPRGAAHSGALLGDAGPVVGGASGRRGGAPRHPGHRHRRRLLLDLCAGPVRGPRAR